MSLLKKYGRKRRGNFNLAEGESSNTRRYTDRGTHFDAVMNSPGPLEVGERETLLMANRIQRSSRSQHSVHATFNLSNDDLGDAGEGQTPVPIRPRLRPHKLWERESSRLKDWFCESFSFDVEKYTLPNNEYNKSDCLLEDLDSDFKAARNGNRKLGGRFDENGVFALCCGRHGIPNTMYDIFGGEGRKYALASVNEAIKKAGLIPKIGLIYDIIYLSKKQIERTFPEIKERTLYAVSLLHAFAHVLSCQMKYHPKYINGFGYTAKLF
ncbi:unnamed protein product [Mucor hiemalis]